MSVLDGEPIEVTFGDLKRFLAKHNVLTDFSGTPQELQAMIEA